MAEPKHPVGNYDVFVSFRGADTRNGFVSHLYHGLKDAGIHVFLDNEELTYGMRLSEELPRAIDNSKIYIPVLSETYASSKWCLRKLSQMVENMKKSDQANEILPVFYGVTLDDFKLKSELFKEQLNKHRENESDEVVEKWTNALKCIIECRGWEVPIDSLKEDAEFCREIIKRVSIILKVKHKQVPEGLVGMEDPTDDLIRLLDIGYPDLRVIGIHGMGGIGKTTLAKVVYDKLCDSFDCCSFLYDVRETLDKDKGIRGCLELQKKLLKDICGHEEDDIRDVDDAVSIIRRKLSGKMVLLVFDDVSEANQIMKLISSSYNLFNGKSRIIITTRYRRVLQMKRSRIKIHEMEELNKQYALQLFSWHAFGRSCPPDEYSLLSDNVLDLTAGLPLSLEVIGSLLFREGKEKWKYIIQRLKTIPNKEVHERLKISYEDLSEEAKEIFLDIACFFVDEKRTNEIYMWEACGFFPQLAIDELLSMRLIKIKEDRYWMHDHIKDLGRKIIRQHGQEDLQHYTRFCLKEDGINILSKRKKFPAAHMPARDLSHSSSWTGEFVEPVSLTGASTTEYEVVFSFADDHQELIQSIKLKMGIVGISVFSNDVKVHLSEYQIAEDFARATDRCKICIPILSKTYLLSARCLRELAYIWGSPKKLGIVIPIFYDVDPWEVNFQYTEAVYEIANDMSTIQLWQETLRKISEIKGWEMKDKDFNKHINLIVNGIFNRLKLKHLNPDFVIMEDQFKEVKKLLDIDSGSVLFVGIHGVSGVGKTALAKIIFNELADQFEGCSFLHNIQEGAENWGLKYLQDQLWRNTADRDINSKEINKKKDRLLNKKVLIVLDDVNQREQINSLVGKTSRLGSGSRIIVTTQDIRVLAVEHDVIDSVLKWPKEVRTFEMRGVIAHTPNSNLALQLFCRHAFGRDSPPDDHRNLSEMLVKAIGGLPLALEIIGSFLNRKPRGVWNSTLSRLQHVHPLEIKEKILISYESLAYETSQIFLDIACFFCHKDKTFPIYMWDACNFFPEQGLEELSLMCLVKIREDNKLWMHDQVKEFGREMARIESFNMGLAQCSRLWVDEEALYVLKRKEVDEEETMKIEALSLGCDESLRNWTFTNESFERTQHLRFLELQGVHLAGNFTNHLLSLRWLQWNSCPAECEATNLQLYDLVILDLSRSQLSHEWRGWSQLGMSRKLKVLNLTSCKSLQRTPDFSSFRVLERLILEDCSSLVEMDESIGLLQQLKYLNLNGCTSLNALPRGIGNLTSLLNLEMDGTGVAELPLNIHKLVKLHSLVLSSCFGIKQLPSSLGYLTLLVHLDLGGTNITELPESIGNMEMLKVLKIEYSLVTRLSKSIGMLRSLEELHARHCVGLAEVDEIWSLFSLRIMDLSFSKIRSLPIKLLSRLQTLRLESCDELQELPELPTSLVRLTITGNCCNFLQELPELPTKWSTGTFTKNIQHWIRHLYKLETLELCIQNITKLELHAMSQLRSLSLSCQDFEICPQFPASLSRLILVNLQEKTKLSTLDNLEKLTFLEFDKCSITNGLESLGVGQIESLEHLSATRCNFSKLNGFNLPKRLRLLSLSECKVLHELDLTGLVNLIHLDVTSCNELREIQGLGELLCLVELSICSCDLVEKLGNLSKLEKLEEVKLIQCEKLKEVEGLDQIKSLKNLHICGCKSLENIYDKIGVKKQKRQQIKA